MGWRFHKSLRIIPGVRLNVAKSSLSVSVGVPPLTVNVKSDGQVMTTASLPGSGLSYRVSRKPAAEKVKEAVLNPIIQLLMYALAAALIIWLMK